MKRKTILKSIVIILLVVEIISLYLLSKPDNKVVLDDVLTMPLKNKRQTLAVMVQQEDNTWKEAENRNAWPSSTTHGFVGSRCYDGNGASVESTDIIQFDLSTYTATINTTSSIYCTLYFAKGTPALDWLKKNGGNTFAGGGEHTTSVDGTYRFKGTNAQVLNNYICFGATLESECLNKPEKYMYRIIGITSETDKTIGLYANQLKIIKAIPLSESQKWHSNYTNNTKWDDTYIKTYLNGTTENETSDGFLQTIIDGADGTYWESMISSHKWYNVDREPISGGYFPKDVPSIEPKTSQTLENKIGLIYASDFVNAYSDFSTDNWLFIKNGWTGNVAKDEWTMSRMEVSTNSYRAWYVTQYGNLDKTSLTVSYVVRPVFYLQSGVNLTGEGTKEHPFIISGVMPQD